MWKKSRLLNKKSRNKVLSNLNEQLTTNIAMLVGAGLFVVLNYFGQRFFAFKTGDEK